MMKSMKSKDDSNVKGLLNDLKMRYEKKRVPQCIALGLEIKEKDFLEKIGLGAGAPIFDVERLFIGG